MKSIKILLVCFAGLFFHHAVAQTPTYFYHSPANAGVNNLFFHTINGRMVFIYTQAELQAMGVPPGFSIGDIYFRHNTANTTSLGDFAITLGHTSNVVPVANFASNFNIGTPVTALNTPIYVYSSNAGAWNVPTANWTSITLTNPFTWNGTDNLAIQLQFSTSSNSVIGFYADNGGVPLTQYNNSRNAGNASSTTSRPMVGFSQGVVLDAEDWDVSVQETNGEGALLAWSFSAADAVLEYVVQRSSSGGNFNDLAILTASSAGKQEFRDAIPAAGVSLYRISAILRDGSVSNSPVARMVSAMAGEITMYPNPIQEHKMLHLAASGTSVHLIEVHDLNGRILKSIPTDLQNGAVQSISLDGISEGWYLIRVVGRERVYTKRIQIL